MKRHPSLDLLVALSESLDVRVEYSSVGPSMVICPSCGLMGPAPVEDVPVNHKADCMLVAARVALGRVREAEERTAKLHGDDLLVNLGDMREADEKVPLDKNYESMVEDYIADFNQMVSQGVLPMHAFFAMSQAFAIIWGSCIRAGLRSTVGHRIMQMIMRNADASSKMIKVITTQ